MAKHTREKGGKKQKGEGRIERDLQSTCANSLWVGRGPLPFVTSASYSLNLGTSSIIYAYACQVAGAAGRFDSLPQYHDTRKSQQLPFPLQLTPLIPFQSA
jgi:hypothetical protein